MISEGSFSWTLEIYKANIEIIDSNIIQIDDDLDVEPVILDPRASISPKGSSKQFKP